MSMRIKIEQSQLTGESQSVSKAPAFAKRAHLYLAFEGSGDLVRVPFRFFWDSFKKFLY